MQTSLFFILLVVFLFSADNNVISNVYALLPTPVMDPIISTTTSTTPIITGTGEPDHFIKLWSDQDLVGAAFVNSEGLWDIMWISGVTLLPGTHSLTIQASTMSSADDSLLSSPYSLLVDPIPPTYTAKATALDTIILTFSENVDVTSTNGIGWSITGDDANSTTVTANTDPAGFSDIITLTLSGNLANTSPVANVVYDVSGGTVVDNAGYEVSDTFTAVITDEIIPITSSASIRNETSVEIVFSENLDDVSYTLNNFDVANNTVIEVSENEKTVTLTLGTALNSNSPPLQITILSDSVYDFSGNGNSEITLIVLPSFIPGSESISYAISSFNATSHNATLSHSLLFSTSSLYSIATIPVDTIISASEWTGVLQLDNLDDVTVPGYDTKLAVQFGAPDMTLTFSKPILINLFEQTGLYSFITEFDGKQGVIPECTVKPPNKIDISNTFPEACYVDDGRDLKIYTLTASIFSSGSEIIIITPPPPIRPVPGGGSGGVSTSVVSIYLYEISWNLCDDNLMQIIVGPISGSIGVQLGTSVLGKIQATLSEDQPYPDRLVYEANISSDENFVRVLITSISNRAYEYLSESINLNSCTGLKTFDVKLILPTDIIESDSGLFIISEIIDNNHVMISGTTNKSIDVTMITVAPNGNIVSINQLSPDKKGEFSVLITTGGPLWNVDGVYSITAQQASFVGYTDDIQIEIVNGLLGDSFENILHDELSPSIIDTKSNFKDDIFNEDDYLIEQNIETSTTSEFIINESSNDVNIGEEKSSKGGGCLIATATYGSEMASQVQLLREIRDNTLLNTETGTSFMNTFNDVYYTFSPHIADMERENSVFKEMVNLAITPMISSLSILNYVDMDSESEVFGYGISLIILNFGMYLGIPAIVIIGIKKKLCLLRS